MLADAEIVEVVVDRTHPQPPLLEIEGERWYLLTAPALRNRGGRLIVADAEIVEVFVDRTHPQPPLLEIEGEKFVFTGCLHS